MNARTRGSARRNGIKLFCKGLVLSPYEIGGKLNESEAGGIPAGRRTPLSRCTAVSHLFHRGDTAESNPLLSLT
jgi:hypothetical protein